MAHSGLGMTTMSSDCASTQQQLLLAVVLRLAVASDSPECRQPSSQVMALGRCGTRSASALSIRWMLPYSMSPKWCGNTSTPGTPTYRPVRKLDITHPVMTHAAGRAKHARLPLYLEHMCYAVLLQHPEHALRVGAG
jgi:hypothetical protein